jgi:hypothetical protein
LFLSLSEQMGPELAGLSAAGLAFMGVSFLCAPYMALLALRGDRSGAGEQGPVGGGPGQVPLLQEGMTG